MWVKICGLRDEGALTAALAGGADAVGFVLAESSRRVTRRELDRLSALAAGKALRVAVFRTVRTDLAEGLVRDGVVDLVQAERFEPSYPDVPYLLVTALELGERFQVPEGAAPFAHVLDRRVGHKSGGTGQRLDPAEARRAARLVRLVLAGGLTPETVAGAVRAVRPFGVDVSSGVERAGAKDPERILKFIAEARKGEVDHGEGAYA